MYHVTAEQMRLIEWARAYNWAIRFLDKTLPDEFQQWFPATDVQYEIMNVNNWSVEGGNAGFDFPKSTQMFDLSMTIVDGSARRGAKTDVLQLHKWISTWGRSIVDPWFGTATLEEACRKLEVIHYNTISNSIAEGLFQVYPTASTSFSGISEGDVSKIEVNFRIAAHIKWPFEFEQQEPIIDVHVRP